MAAIQHPTLSGLTNFNGSNCHLQRERMGFANNTMVIAMPGEAPTGTTASAQAQHTAIFGPTRTITIPGMFKGTATQLSAFIQEIDDWQNDGNPEAKAYTNYLGKVYEGTFLPLEFNYEFSIDATNLLDFTLTIVEGTKIT